MRRALRLHPDSFCRAVTASEVEISRPAADRLLLRYSLSGRIDDLLLPPLAASARADGLWQHTCFEAFLRLSDEVYFEFNFAPSTEWAAYRFSGYRSGMEPAREPNLLAIDVRTRADFHELRAELHLALPPEVPWHLGLSAVIEETSGGRSYWALAHPPGEPDFHHKDCFALVLPSPASS